jgi:hypothetical protein
VVSIHRQRARPAGVTCNRTADVFYDIPDGVGSPPVGAAQRLTLLASQCIWAVCITEPTLPGRETVWTGMVNTLARGSRRHGRLSSLYSARRGNHYDIHVFRLNVVEELEAGNVVAPMRHHASCWLRAREWDGWHVPQHAARVACGDETASIRYCSDLDVMACLPGSSAAGQRRVCALFSMHARFLCVSGAHQRLEQQRRCAPCLLAMRTLTA